MARDATFQKGFKTEILQFFSQIQVVNYGHIPSQGNELHTVSNSLECQNYSSHLLLKHIVTAMFHFRQGCIQWGVLHTQLAKELKSDRIMELLF